MKNFFASLVGLLVWNIGKALRGICKVIGIGTTYSFKVQSASYWERNGMAWVADAVEAHRVKLYSAKWLAEEVRQLRAQLDRETYERQAAQRHANNLLNIMRETREREAEEWAQHVREVVRERVERAMLLDDVRNIVVTLRDNVETAETYASVTASAMQLEAFDASFENLEELREKLQELAHVGNESFEELEEELYNAQYE